MTDRQPSELLDDEARELLEAIAAGYLPTADLVPTAIAAARRESRRRRFNWGITGLATAAVAVAVLMVVAPGSAPGAGGGEAGHGSSRPGATGSPSAAAVAITVATPDPGCVGVWLPWTDQSDASLFGKGTNAQRAIVCTEDTETIKSIYRGVTIAPEWETYADGQRADFTWDQITKMGAGLSPNTHILRPWQYDLTLNGHRAYFYVTYSATRTDICTSCILAKPQDLALGYKLVSVVPPSGQKLMPEDLVETPQHSYLGIGLSPLSGGSFVPPFDITQLLHDGRFIAALNADLHELYGTP